MSDDIEQEARRLLGEWDGPPTPEWLEARDWIDGTTFLELSASDLDKITDIFIERLKSD